MPIRSRYTRQKFNRDFANAEPGNVIRFPDGSEAEVVRTVTQETPEQKAARLKREEGERERARDYQARCNKTEARKVSRKTYAKTPAGKAIKAVKDKARDAKEARERRTAPFWGLDGEGVSIIEQAWIEPADGDPARPKKPKASSYLLMLRPANTRRGATKRGGLRSSAKRRKAGASEPS